MHHVTWRVALSSDLRRIGCSRSHDLITSFASAIDICFFSFAFIRGTGKLPAQIISPDSNFAFCWPIVADSNEGEHVTIIADDRPSLLTVPQELIGLIFDAAFGSRDEIRIVSKEAWDERREVKVEFHRLWELAADLDSLPPMLPTDTRPYPGSAAVDLMVSKKCFLLAAEAYLGRRRIIIELWLGKEASRGEGIIPVFVREASLRLKDWRRYPPMPRLETLHVGLHNGQFGGDLPLLAMEDRMLDQDELHAT